MSETLIAIAHTAFSHHDWPALIQCLRQCPKVPHREEDIPNTHPYATGKVLRNGQLVSSETSLSQSVAQNMSQERARQDASLLEPTSADIEAILGLATQVLLFADFQTRWELVSVISKFGIMAIAPLVDLLNGFEVDDDDEGDWDLLWFIARILGQIHHPEAIATLVQVLQTSPSEDVVTATIMALSQQGHGAIAPLLRLLEHDVTKLTAVQALARIFVKDPEQSLRERLITISQDADATVRAVVVEALSHSHHSDVAPILVHALDDIASGVRRAAVVGLGLQSKTISDDILLAALEPRLWDLDADVRRQTAIALGRVQSPEAAALLATALQSQDFPTPLKPDVVRALIWTDTQRGIDSLSDYLQNQLPKAEIYQEIAVMLGRVTVPMLQEPATRLLLDFLDRHAVIRQSVIIRQSVAMSLGQLKQPMAEPALIALTQDEEERVRLHAIAALKTLKNEWPERSPQNKV